MNQVPTVDAIVDALLPIWATALDAPVTPESDFLALGGDSLAAIAIATAITERYPGCEELELAALQATFQSPTLRAAAEAVQASMRNATTTTRVTDDES